MKIGIIGCGAMGRLRAHSVRKLPGVSLAGVYDRSANAASELAAQCGTTGYTSFERMAAEANPDAVCICLPASLHMEYAIKAARAGKHVFCEAPIAAALSEAQAMAEACREAGVKLGIGQPMRLMANYANAKREIESGAIGDVGVVHMKRTGPAGDAPLGGDRVVFDWLVHEIDFVRSVLGEVSRVYALNRTTEGQDYALITLRFRSGAIVNLEGHVGHPSGPSCAVEFAGMEGLIRFDSGDISPLRILQSGDAANASGLRERFAQTGPLTLSTAHYATELGHFVEAVRTGKEPAVAPADACRSLEIALAAAESAQKGSLVRIEPFGSETGGKRHVS